MHFRIIDKFTNQAMSFTNCILNNGSFPLCIGISMIGNTIQYKTIYLYNEQCHTYVGNNIMCSTHEVMWHCQQSMILFNRDEVS